MLQHFDENCKKCGLSITVQRQQVYQALLDNKHHPTVDTVFETVRQTIPSISRATVYRTLETLADEGLIQRVMHPGSSVRYDGIPKPHHHLVCTVCGKTEDFTPPNIPEIPCPHNSSTGFTITDCEITFRGICPECQKKSKQKHVVN